MALATKITEAKTKMTAMFGALSIGGSETWFYLAGGIGAVALAVGFIAAATGLLFGWKMNKEQQGETAVKIASVESGAKERIASVETAANERIETARAEAAKEAQRIESTANQKIEEAKAQARKDVAAARVRQDEIALELRTKAKDLADAQRDAATAQLALKKHLEEVAERQKGREFTAAQRKELLEFVTVPPEGDLMRLTIVCVQDNLESCGFAKQVADILTEARWAVSGPAAQLYFGPSRAPIVGLRVFVRTEDVVPMRAVRLGVGLKNIGFPAVFEESKAMGQDDVVLFVGVKPIN